MCGYSRVIIYHWNQALMMYISIDTSSVQEMVSIFHCTSMSVAEFTWFAREWCPLTNPVNTSVMFRAQVAIVAS